MELVALKTLHRRLAVVMGLAGLVAFAGGAGFEPLSTLLAGAALVVALFWQPSPELSSRLERVWVPLAGLLVLRALFHVLVVGDDVVIPVVDLLLLLLSAESLRSLDAPNDTRLYALSFALLLASAAYRPGIAFGIAFVVYVAVGTVALTVGHLRRQARRNRGGRVPVGPRLLFGVAGLSGVTLLLSAAVFVTFPRAARSWASRGDVSPAPVTGFADEVDLGSFGATIRGNPRVVLRVEFSGEPPAETADLYWRGRSYDHFDGTRWSRSARLPPALAPERWYDERWPDARVEQTIYAVPLRSRVLFGLHPIVGIDAESAIQPHFDNAGDFTYWGSAAPAYRATSVAGRPAPSELRNASGRFAPAREHYVQLPELPARVHGLADSLTRDLDTRYDRVVAVRDWLRSEFSYTLDLPRSSAEASLDHFLFERRRGHCEYFSTAMTILLRTQGIPARNVNGFLGGEWSRFGDYLAVTQNEAHSWVEVWFPDFGWVAFDPTPAGVGGSGGGEAWFWPGRFLLDGLQHRWNRWVLDYDVDTQWDLLERVSGALSEDPEGAAPSRGSDGTPGGRLVWGGLVLAAVLAGGALALARRDDRPPVTRRFLELRRRVRDAGFVDAEGAAPLALVGALRSAGHPAASPAAEVVDLYLRVRFGRASWSPAVASRMDRALDRTRRSLRVRPATHEDGRGGGSGR